MLESVARIGRHARAEQQLRLFELRQCARVARSYARIAQTRWCRAEEFAFARHAVVWCACIQLSYHLWRCEFFRRSTSRLLMPAAICDRANACADGRDWRGYLVRQVDWPRDHAQRWEVDAITAWRHRLHSQSRCHQAPDFSVGDVAMLADARVGQEVMGQSRLEPVLCVRSHGLHDALTLRQV